MQQGDRVRVRALVLPREEGYVSIDDRGDVASGPAWEWFGATEVLVFTVHLDGGLRGFRQHARFMENELEVLSLLDLIAEAAV